MAFGLSIRFDGGTEDQYQTLHSHMQVDQNPPEGLIFHSAGPVAGGWRVIDFWQSRAAFQQFMESRMGPASQELGDRTFTTPPEIEEFAVHNFTKS